MFTVPVVPLSLSSLLTQVDIQYQQFEICTAELHFVSDNQKCNTNLKINLLCNLLY